MTTTTYLPFTLAAGLNPPDIYEATAQAYYQNNYNSFTSLMGAAPGLISFGINYNEPISSWVGDAQWQSVSLAASSSKSASPLIALPLFSNASGSASIDQQLQAMASGSYDGTLRGIVQAWVNAGYKTMDFRVGWEMNVPGTPTFIGSGAQVEADWVKAFQHVYTVLHQQAAADGASVTIAWSPDVGNSDTDNSLVNLYPGNNYVDVIAPDVYADAYPYYDNYNPTQIHDWGTGGEDTTLAQWISNPANLAHFWNYPSANEYVLNAGGTNTLTLQNVITFAEQQGKPFAVGETGAGNSAQGHDVTDDAAFPQWLAQTLAAAQAAGETVSFVNIWDENGGGSYEFSNSWDNKPNEAAAWAQYFGLQTVTTSTPVTQPVTGQGSSGATTSTGTSGTTVTLGSGSSTITLAMAEDFYQQNAQFVVSVDGAQIGGTQTVTAIAGLDQTEFFNLLGNWGAGTHNVAVYFLNDLYGGAPNADVNLYVRGAAFNGVSSPESSAVLLVNGGASLTVGGTAPGPITLGSGSDILSVNLSEQAYQGDAVVGFFVDGKQIGSNQTLSALNGIGQNQVFNLKGNFGTGSHDVAISLVNPDTSNSYPNAQRAVFLNSATIDGSTITGISQEIDTGAAQGFAFNPSGIPTTIVGSGADSLELYVSETGSPSNFTVSVDGQTVGGTLTTTANSNYGQSQAVVVQGNWAAGSTNNVSVNYLNPNGNALTVEAATINGNTIAGSTSISSGADNFSFAAPSVPQATVVGGSGPDTLVLNMSEDFYQGNAQFTVSVDGQQMGGVQTATAIHGLGQSQQFDVFGSFSGSHAVSVNYLNDAYGGSSALDRNLYISSASVNGTGLNGSNLAFYNPGAQTIYFQH